MATLTVLKFDSPTGAAQMLDKIKSMQKMQLITLQDAAIVSWPEGKKGPKTKQLVNMAGMGALDGAFWGMLFGLLFFAPWLGLAVGAAFGALGGKMRDYGIDDDFIKSDFVILCGCLMGWTKCYGYRPRYWCKCILLLRLHTYFPLGKSPNLA